MKKVTLFSVIALAGSMAVVGCAKRPYVCSCDCSQTPGKSSEVPAQSSEIPASSIPTSEVPSPTTYENVSEKIIVWCAAEEEQVMKAVVDDYNSKQTKDTSKFNYEFVAVAEGDGGTEIAKNPQAATAASLFNFADDQVYSLQSKNILVEYSGTFKERALANNTEFSLKGAMYKNKMYGVPYTADNGYFLWYDADVLSESDVLSLETILSKTDKTHGFLMDIANGYYQSSFLLSPEGCGTNSLSWKENDDGVAVYTTNWDDSQGVKISEYLNGLLKPLFDNDYLKTGSNPEIAAGLQPGGSLIAAVSGTWMESDVVGKGRNIKAAKLPEFHPDGLDKPGYQMASYAGSKLLGINNFTSMEKKQAAICLADLMTSEAAQKVRLNLRKTLPSNKAVAESPEVLENMTVGGLALTAQMATNAFAMQASSAEARFWDVGKAIGQAWLDGDLGKFKSWSEFLKFQMNLIRNA